MAFSRPFTPTNPQSRSGGGVGTPPDQEMSDQAQPSPRPSLPSSINDFGLVPSSSAPSSPSTTLMALDEPMASGATSPFASPSSAWNYAFNPASNAHPLLRKPRRPSMLGLGIMRPATDTFMTPPNSSGGSTSRMNSPLISSFSSPFAFNAPPLGTYAQNTDKTRRQAPDIEDDYAPELLYASSSSNTNEAQDDPESVLSATRTPVRHRVSRSLSPATPDASRGANDVDPMSMSDALANNLSSRLRRSSGTMLRQASISSSSSGSGLPSASTSSAVPIPNASRRLALPRLQNLISESDLAETEVKSEAAFQRFVTSHADMPTPFRSYPRTPRSRTSTSGSGPSTTLGGRQPQYPDDRGRFPEEARVEDERAAEDDNDGSSDGFGADDGESAAGATAMSFTEESVMEVGMGSSKLGLSHAGSSGSLGASMGSPGAGMDLDMGASGPQLSYGNSPISGPNGSNGSLNLNGSGSWRHTPPPSGSSGRVGKRKFDDRYDPYPSAKRRAVSPAISISTYPHSHSHGSLASPITLPRSPISIPRPLPASTTSSPILRPVVRLSERYSISGGGGGNGSGSGGMMTSGIGLVGMGLGGGVSWSSATGTVSKAEEKEVSGAGDGVGSLTL